MKKKISEQNYMDKSRRYLYILYVLLVIQIFALCSCASDDLAVDGGQQQGTRMSLGIDVAQITGSTKTRVAAPAIKSYQMKSEGKSKPVYAQFSSEAFINRHNTRAAQNADKQETRGVSITAAAFYDRFGLFYYQYGKDETWKDIVSDGTPTPTANNMAVEKSKGWLTDKYWPGADYKLTFFAYAPYSSDYTSVSIPTVSNFKGYPRLSYRVPGGVGNQKDLVVSAEEATQDIVGDYNKVVAMRFYHVLSAINFKIGSTMAPCRIDKIEIKNVYGFGVYDFGTKQWESLGSINSYSITPNYVVGDERGVVFTGVDDTKNDLMLLMPQTVPAGAKLVVTIGDGANFATQHQMELPLEGHEWLPGYTITYSLSTAQENSDYVFSVSKISSIDKAAATVNYNVSSFVQSYYGSQTPVGWKAKYAIDDQIDNDEYSEDFGHVVKGFTFDMPSPTASTSSVTANISELDPPVSSPTNNTHTAALRAATPLGTQENPYDLSTLGDTRSRSTANCYIVQAPGWYKIPLVYGNAIKNGANNTAVYGSSSSMATFVNHLGSQISSPWLYQNTAVTPNDAVLLWQDAYNMIDSVSLGVTTDRKFLYFKVNADYICQGNAVISVRNSNKAILWSWHIWVTDEEYSSATNVPVTAYNTAVYNFMPVPLGHCQPDRRYYKGRKIKFRFEQDKSELTAEVTFAQSTTSYVEFGQNATYYQFGRSFPEPILCTGLAKALKPLYNTTEYPATNVSGHVAINVAMQHPTTHYCNSSYGTWNNKYAKNEWDVKNTGTEAYGNLAFSSVKSIYDPCPVGYKVPEPAAFTGFTTTGDNTTNSSKFNTSGSFNRGMTFYTKPNKLGSTFYIYAYNFVSYSNGQSFVHDFGTSTYLWTSGVYNNYQGRLFYFRRNGSTDYVYPLSSAVRAYACPVLPVADN